MFKTVMSTIVAAFIATSASAVGIQIQEGDKLSAPSPVVKLNVTVKNSADFAQKITLQSLNGSPWNSKVVKFPSKDFKLLPAGDQGNIPMFLKIQKKGKFKIVVCAAEEPFTYAKPKENVENGVEVNITVRACDSILVTRY